METRRLREKKIREGLYVEDPEADLPLPEIRPAFVTPYVHYNPNARAAAFPTLQLGEPFEVEPAALDELLKLDPDDLKTTTDEILLQNFLNDPYFKTIEGVDFMNFRTIDFKNDLSDDIKLVMMAEVMRHMPPAHAFTWLQISPSCVEDFLYLYESESAKLESIFEAREAANERIEGIRQEDGPMTPEKEARMLACLKEEMAKQEYPKPVIYLHKKDVFLGMHFIKSFNFKPDEPKKPSAVGGKKAVCKNADHRPVDEDEFFFSQSESEDPKETRERAASFITNNYFALHYGAYKGQFLQCTDIQAARKVFDEIPQTWMEAQLNCFLTAIEAEERYAHIPSEFEKKIPHPQPTREQFLAILRGIFTYDVPQTIMGLSFCEEWEDFFLNWRANREFVGELVGLEEEGIEEAREAKEEQKLSKNKYRVRKEQGAHETTCEMAKMCSDASASSDDGSKTERAHMPVIPSLMVKKEQVQHSAVVEEKIIKNPDSAVKWPWIGGMHVEDLSTSVQRYQDNAGYS
ncbi:hypothetical protein BJ878DRAFT_565737 [Calycina marina]|uniref:Uncharacterized protein n=1 Tax=Calycina marina TaxID=1763456 RepID=A0A9P7Z6Y4_9HELO|nr:hypothetical protein BJ878DRAFT_565737 [Calycina marina]